MNESNCDLSLFIFTPTAPTCGEIDFSAKRKSPRNIYGSVFHFGLREVQTLKGL